MLPNAKSYPASSLHHRCRAVIKAWRPRTSRDKPRPWPPKGTRMSEERVSFTSKGLKLAGMIRVPDGLRPGERRPAFIILHGFGSRMTADNVMRPTTMFEQLGYVCMRFDMPGCGESEGEMGLLLCPDQVTATSDALTLLAQHPSVDGNRIAVIGSSFGAAVAVYCGGVDPRVAAVLSASGWGDGETKFRGQHRSQDAWRKF